MGILSPASDPNIIQVWKYSEYVNWVKLLCPELTEILETQLYQLYVFLKGRGYMIFF